MLAVVRSSRNGDFDRAVSTASAFTGHADRHSLYACRRGQSLPWPAVMAASSESKGAEKEAVSGRSR